MDDTDSGPQRKRRSAICAVALISALYVSAPVLAQTGSGPAESAPSSATGNLIAVFVLIVINGLFAMTEAAFLTVRRTRIEQLVEEGNRAARTAASLLNEPTRTLSTIQVGVTFVSLLSAGAAADAAVAPLRRWLAHQSSGTFVAHYAGPIAFIAIMASVAFLTLVLGEITPKSLAVQRAEPIVLATALPLRALQTCLSPAITVVTRVSDFIVRPFGGKATFHPTAMSEEELKLMVEQSEEYGVIERQEKEMIHSIFEFADTAVRKVMTPRLDITALPDKATLADLIGIAKETGHSRLPVYEEDLDRIIGVIHVKDVIDHLTADDPVTVRDFVRPPYFVPENKRVDDLLTDFRRTKNHMAVVRNEYGTVTGIVTIEDLLEEIVGEIQDEYDTEETELALIDGATIIADARMPLEDFNDRMGCDLPTEESDTLGGFVFGLLGHQPEQGEEIQCDGLSFRVEITDGLRLQKIRVTRSDPLPTEQESAATQSDTTS